MRMTARVTRGGLGGPGSAQQHLDYIMGPKDIRSTTWYLNKVRLRTWDHFQVITRIEGREPRTKKGSQRMGGLGQ